MVKANKSSKILLSALIILTLVVLCFNFTFTTASAETQDELGEQGKLLDFTYCSVFHSSGKIYYISQYKFSKTNSHTFNTTDGKTVTLGYEQLVPIIKNLAEKQGYTVEYNESIPNVISVIKKQYNSLTELYHDRGITGNEVEEATPSIDTFWFKTYVSTSKTYLGDSGESDIKDSWTTIVQVLFKIPQADTSLVRFNYCYGTEFKSITSDAKYVKYNEEDKMFYHIFSDINGDTEVTIYQKTPNRPNWYGVLVGGSLGAIALGVAIILITKKVRKKRIQ